MPLPKATYDVTRSYEWNYENGPLFDGAYPDLPRKVTGKFLGFDICVPIGVPAGPLLNAKYIELYAKMGFDVLSYKTVRSVERISHPAPNCLYIKENYIDPKKQDTPVYVAREPDSMNELSITNSFGMPSMAPSIWQSDVEKAKKSLRTGQVLIVSLVGTKVEERNYLDDWAYTAGMVRESGADVIELDISCPNVTGGAGQIFQDPVLTRDIVMHVRKVIGTTPLVLKVGYFDSDNLLLDFVKMNGPLVEGICAINTLRMEVLNEDKTQALPGEGRNLAGVCGAAIKPAGLHTARKLVEMKRMIVPDLTIMGVGGIISADDFQEYLETGVDIALSGTGAMWNPYLAQEYYREYRY
jgi:dihydroorotate dehydrogenase